MAKIFGTETQATIAQWALETFGDVKSERSIITRALCEMVELVHAVETGESPEKIASEIADVIIVLCRYPVTLPTETSWAVCADVAAYINAALHDLEKALTVPRRGWRIPGLVQALKLATVVLGVDLPAAIDAKMKINRARRWERKGAGHGQHIKDAPAITRDDAKLLYVCVDAGAVEAFIDDTQEQYLDSLVEKLSGWSRDKAFAVDDTVAAPVTYPADQVYLERLRIAADKAWPAIVADAAERRPLQPPPGSCISEDVAMNARAAEIRASALNCDHANEVPTACPCAPGCYCKTRSCAVRAAPVTAAAATARVLEFHRTPGLSQRVVDKVNARIAAHGKIPRTVEGEALVCRMIADAQREEAAEVAHDKETLRLAAEYRAATEARDAAWRTLVAADHEQPALGHPAQRNAYHKASGDVKHRCHALLMHIAGELAREDT